MPADEFRVGDHSIGEDHAPFVIAEAGVHHGNSVELAKEYVTQARIAGAHAIKFQTYRASRLAARWAPTYWVDDAGRSQYDIFAERDRMTAEGYRRIAEHARDVGIVFLSTPFDPDSARLLDELGIPAFKIASADVTNLPLLDAVAALGKPVLLSTGASTLQEIQRAVATVRAHGVSLALLHCTLAYPTPLGQANLQRIGLLRREFPDAVIGYSDHTQPQDSEHACPIAVALGARVVEKHYTLNKALTGDDHYHAVDQAGLVRLVSGCRDAYAMSRGCVEVSESELPARTYARRSIVAALDLPAGHLLGASDIDFKRPGTGLEPRFADRVVGRRVRRAIAADQCIALEDLE
jgi:N-acetylneuraminate synthase